MDSYANLQCENCLNPIDYTKPTPKVKSITFCNQYHPGKKVKWTIKQVFSQLFCVALNSSQCKEGMSLCSTCHAILIIACRRFEEFTSLAAENSIIAKILKGREGQLHPAPPFINLPLIRVGQTIKIESGGFLLPPDGTLRAVIIPGSHCPQQYNAETAEELQIAVKLEPDYPSEDQLDEDNFTDDQNDSNFIPPEK